MGQVIGTSDKNGEQPEDIPVYDLYPIFISQRPSWTACSIALGPPVRHARGRGEDDRVRSPRKSDPERFSTRGFKPIREPPELREA